MCKNDECLLQEMSGQPAASHGNWYYVWSEFDIFTNNLEEGINGPLMKSTDEVEWLIRCKKAEKLVILVRWDATCANAHSSLKQEITIWKSFNGTNQSRKYQCQQRPGGGAGGRLDRDGRLSQNNWSFSLEWSLDIWPVFMCFPQLLTPSQSLWNPFCFCLVASLSSHF